MAIACSLGADELPARLREIRAIGEAALLDSEVSAASAVLRFSADADVRQRLEAIVAAESRCCAFMTFDLRDEGGRLALRIEAPEDAQAALEQLAAAFTPKDP
jgi:hypothetical protein